MEKEENTEKTENQQNEVKEEKKEVQQIPKKKSINIKLIFVLILLVIILYFIFRKPFIRNCSQFPYIWTEAFNKTIRNYVNKYPSRDVLFITGGYRTGKSRALDIIANELKQEGRLAITLDAKNFWPIQTFLNSIKGNIATTLIQIKQNLPSDTIKKLTEKRAKRNSRVFENYTMPNNLDPCFYGVYLSLAKTIDQIYNETERKVSAFYVSKFFDRLEFYKDYLKPVVIIHNYDSLLSIRQNASRSNTISLSLLDSIESRFKRRNLYRDFVPVLLEVKDTLFLVNESENELLTPTSVARTAPATKKESEILIQQKYLTKSEFNKLHKKFGGHIGHFVECYEDMVYADKDFTINDAINNRMNDLKEELNRIMNDYSKQNAKKICRKKATADMIDSLKPLIKRGYVIVEKDLSLSFGSKAVQEIIC